MSDAFTGRADRYSQLLGRSMTSNASSGSLVSRSILTEAEHEELRTLQPEAHEAFLVETDRATVRLRRLLAKGDPFYTLTMLQISNMTAPAGDYFEPTHRGMENKVELAAGLLVTQQPPATIEPASHGYTQRIYDEIDHLITLSTLVNLSAPTRGDEALDQIRFASALTWTTTRGTSYAHHGRELAEAVYGPFATWSMQRLGFTVTDVLSVGEAAEELFETRHNSARRTLAQARTSAPLDRFGQPERQAIAVPLERFWQQAGASGSFTVDDLPARLDRTRAQAVLDELSIELGSVPAVEYRGLFDRSARWSSVRSSRFKAGTCSPSPVWCFASQLSSWRSGFWPECRRSRAVGPRHSIVWRSTTSPRSCPALSATPISTTATRSSTGWCCSRTSLS